MRLTLLAIAFLFLSCVEKKELDTDSLTGRVVKIADGDTFTLLTENRVQVKIRLHGIDAPERSQDFGQVSKNKLSELVFGKQVVAKRTTTDRYKRTVAVVYVDGNNVNEEMLRAGMAWHFKKYDSNTSWAAMEEEARKNQLGLWSHPSPIPPWQFRRK